jgi:glyoxylase-like metal-dependent hydrolase (beta-lactamase superfamily II)
MIQSISVGPIGENVHIAESPGRPVAIIDPGAEAARILPLVHAALARVGSTRVVVVCTHGHLDHVAALNDVLVGLRAADITVESWAPAGDRAYFGASSEATNRRLFMGLGAMAFFNEYWRPIPEVDVYYVDGEAIADCGLTAIHTPGHTAGSSCLLAEDGKDLLSGDTLFAGGRGRTDNFDSDEAAIIISIREKLLRLPDAVRVWPGHGGTTTIGIEKHYYF